MHYRRSLVAVALTILCLTGADALAWDDTKYPDLKGQWRRTEPGDPTRFDPSKPAGPRTAGPAHAGVSGSFRGRASRPRRWRHRPRSVVFLPPARHAAHHERLCPD